MRLVRLIALVMVMAVQCVSGETWAPEWVTVVRPGGQLVGVVQWDRYLEERGESGLPHLAEVMKRSIPKAPLISRFPREFRGEEVKGAHRFGDRLTLLRTDGDDEYRCQGYLGVLDDQGNVAFAFPERFELVGVGWILPTSPRVFTAGRYAVIERKDRMECIDLLTGRTLWTRTGQLGPESSGRLHIRQGLWARDGALLLSQEDGLFKVDIRSGRTLWRCPMVGPRILNVRRGPDGNEYVTSILYPKSVVESLRAKLTEREPELQGAIHIILPHRLGDVFFASVNWRNAKPERSIWEYAGGRWQRVFDYDFERPDPEKDELFQGYQFSPWMRKRLEIMW